MEVLQLLIFLAVSLGVMAGAFVWSEVSERDERRGVKRLGQSLSKTSAEKPSESLFKSVAEFDLDTATLVLDETSGPPTLPPTSGEMQAAPPAAAGPPPSFLTRQRARLRESLERAGLHVKPRVFLALSAGAALLLVTVGWLLQGALLAAPAALAGGAAPWLYLRMRLNARRNKLLRQMPSAFDLMARVLRSGLSLPQALQGVAEAFESPIASEFARCRDEQNLGMLPEVSFRAMAERMGVLEMKIFVMAMLIQRQTGGNLSEILERLAGLIRERLRTRSHVSTLTAEGRLQAVILLVLPAVIFIALRIINRPYTDVLLDHPEWLAVMGVLMAVGALWIRKTIDIE